MYKYMHAHTYMCTHYSHALCNSPMILYTLSRQPALWLLLFIFMYPLHLHIVCSIHVIYMHCMYTYVHTCTCTCIHSFYSPILCATILWKYKILGTKGRRKSRVGSNEMVCLTVQEEKGSE